ncbi:MULTISPECIES: hypothetical protein [unclassified Bacillus (in: firmicutes)]|uniref:hypothetical protein n=1 Tax=unclassified Bacillus (in: firmicutes) TaxID=185979 RepID=UPI001BEACA06|nr:MULTISPECIES: hypothetical protein [unclassified Bacillus (in: firmicutes)]MBT2615052.1 hypothetical protein [Bacillus sp. ISL-78]MBT2627669.1 hypothetical protein [Bacillus sp. ISL-101]
MAAMKLDLKENGTCIQNVKREFNNLQVHPGPRGPEIMIFAAVTYSGRADGMNRINSKILER